jgi:hypothetical protein
VFVVVEKPPTAADHVAKLPVIVAAFAAPGPIAHAATTMPASVMLNFMIDPRFMSQPNKSRALLPNLTNGLALACFAIVILSCHMASRRCNL